MFLKIEFKHHLLLYSLSTTLWALFLLGGLSSEYYQTWSFLKALLIVDVMPLILLVPLSYYILKYVVGHHFVLSGVVAAFYGSVPLVIYDYIFIGTLVSGKPSTAGGQ